MKIAIKSITGKNLTEKLFTTIEEAKSEKQRILKIYRKMLKNHRESDFPRFSLWKKCKFVPISFSIGNDWDIVFFNQNHQNTPISKSKVIKTLDSEKITRGVNLTLSNYNG